MASVWKHPESANWFARYRGARGKVINRSTGTRDEVEAGRIAKQWEIDAERERECGKPEVSPGGINDAIVRAERLARQGRLDPAAVRDIMNGLLVASGQNTLDAVSNRTLCENWLASKVGVVKERSRVKYDQVCREWLRFLSTRADKPLEQVTKADAIAFRENLRKEGLSPRTINQTVKLVRGMYQEAVEQGHIGRNPFAGMKNLRDSDDGTKRLPFTSEEVERLIATAEDDWKGFILLSATTGMRLSDAATVEARQLDREAQLIRLKAAKNGYPLTLPLHPAFAKWLEKQPRSIGKAPIFPTLAHKPGPGKSGLSMAFKKLMVRAGVEAGRARTGTGKGRTTSQKSFHSFRHFATSQMAAEGIRNEIAQAITGHSDADTHAHYVSPDIAALRKAVNAIKITA